MPGCALLALVLAVPCAAPPPRPATAWPDDGDPLVGGLTVPIRVAVPPDEPRGTILPPRFPKRRGAILLGTTPAGERAVAEWRYGAPLRWGRVLLLPGVFPDDSDVADLEACYRARGFLDVRVTSERVQLPDSQPFTFPREHYRPDEFTLYRVCEGPRYRIRKQVDSHLEGPVWATAALLPGGCSPWAIAGDPEDDLEALRWWGALRGCEARVTTTWARCPDRPGTAVLRYEVRYVAIDPSYWRFCR